MLSQFARKSCAGREKTLSVKSKLEQWSVVTTFASFFTQQCTHGQHFKARQWEHFKCFSCPLPLWRNGFYARFLFCLMVRAVCVGGGLRVQACGVRVHICRLFIIIGLQFCTFCVAMMTRRRTSRHTCVRQPFRRAELCIVRVWKRKLWKKQSNRLKAPSHSQANTHFEPSVFLPAFSKKTPHVGPLHLEVAKMLTRPTRSDKSVSTKF